MTILNAWLKEREFVCVMDTLSYDGERPHNFVSKIFPLPHLGGLICGMGAFELVLSWHGWVQGNVIANSMLFANHAAPHVLPKMFARLNKETRSTIYHFGLHPQTHQMFGTVFRSKNGFVSEPLQYGLLTRPGFDSVADVNAFVQRFVGETGSSTPVAILVAIAREQKRRQQAEMLDTSDDDRLMVGGEIHAFTMTERGQALWTVERFSDYDQVFEEILARAKQTESDDNGKESGAH